MGNTTGKVIAAAGTGLAIGAALGILFAPAKGSKTRKNIKDKATDLTDSAKEKIDSIDIAGLVNNMKETISTEFEEGKEEVRASLLSKIEMLEARLKK